MGVADVRALTSAAAWEALWRRLGAPRAPEGAHAELVAAYGAPHRHYHTLEHLAECLALAEEWRGEFARADEACLALWAHDVVWSPALPDAEARSADWVQARMREGGLTNAAAGRVAGLVLATTHLAPAPSPDAALVQDIDLAVLGADPARFDRYDAAIRAEYAAVPDAAYRAGRREVLARFAGRTTVYSTPVARARFEAAARRNLARALGRL